MSNDIISRVRIEGDAKGATAALKEVQTETKNMNKGIKESKTAFDELFNGLAGFVGVAGIVRFGRDVFDAAGNLEVLQNRAKVLFGTSFPEVEDSSRSMGEQLKRSASDVLNLQSQFAGVVTGAGISGKGMRDMTTELSKLTVGFQNFYGLNNEEALQLISGGLVGMGRGLQRLGFILPDVNASMSEAEKLQIRYNYLIGRGKELHLDNAASMSTYKGNLEEFKSAWGDFLETVGTPLLPIASASFRGIEAFFKDMARDIETVKVALINLKTELSAMFTGGKFGEMNGYAVKDYSTDQFRSRNNQYTKENEVAMKALDKATKDTTTTIRNFGSVTSESAQKVGTALSDLETDYQTAVRDIEGDLRRLEFTHEEKMQGIQDSMKRVQDSLRDLASEYKKTTDNMGRDMADSLVDQEKKIKKLNEEITDALSKIEGKTGKSVSSGGYESILQIPKGNEELKRKMAERDREQAGFERSKKALFGTGVTEEATRRGALTDIDLKTEDFFRSKKDAGDTKTKREGELNDEMVKLQEKSDRETEAYTILKQNITSTKDEMTSFHNQYTGQLDNMKIVTETAIESIKKKLEEMKKVLSDMDANAQAAARLGAGGATTARRASRATGGYVTEDFTIVGERGPEMVSLPYGSYVHPNRETQKMLAPTITIGSVNVYDDADENRLVAKLTRMIQLQSLSSL